MMIMMKKMISHFKSRYRCTDYLSDAGFRNLFTCYLRIYVLIQKVWAYVILSALQNMCIYFYVHYYLLLVIHSYQGVS